MTLKKYLEQQELSAQEFADRAKLDLSTISRYLSGQRKPDIYALSKIRAATGGKVDIEDFLNA